MMQVASKSGLQVFHDKGKRHLKIAVTDSMAYITPKQKTVLESLMFLEKKQNGNIKRTVC